MAALDNCEPQILNALIRDGWHVTDKPYYMRSGMHALLADIRLQKGVNGRQSQVIVTEVKCFTDPKLDLANLYTAVGQYIFYRVVLENNQIFTPLYLAVPEVAYLRLIQDEIILDTFQSANMKFVLVNLETEEVVRWIN